MKIALGSDHRGDAVATAVIAHLKSLGHSVLVLGACGPQPRDYPDQAWEVSNAVAKGESERGILLCGSGIGVCIAANKIKGVRAALVHDELSATMSRSHNDANVLCLAADTTPQKEILAIIEAWLKTPFEGGRHDRRVRKIAAMERGQDPRQIGG